MIEITIPAICKLLNYVPYNLYLRGKKHIVVIAKISNQYI